MSIRQFSHPKDGLRVTDLVLLPYFQIVEIFEPCVRNLDPGKFEIRNIYGTKISQVTV